MTVREPEYDNADRASLYALYDRANEPKNALGIPLSEATDPKHQYEWEADLPVIDFAAQAVSNAQERYRKAYKDADMSVRLWSVKRRSAAFSNPPEEPAEGDSRPSK